MITCETPSQSIRKPTNNTTKTNDTSEMGVQKCTRKFATVKRIIGQRDARLKKNIAKNETSQDSKKKKEQRGGELTREVYASPPA